MKRTIEVQRLMTQNLVEEIKDVQVQIALKEMEEKLLKFLKENNLKVKFCGEPNTANIYAEFINASVLNLKIIQQINEILNNLYDVEVRAMHFCLGLKLILNEQKIKGIKEYIIVKGGSNGSK